MPGGAGGGARVPRRGLGAVLACMLLLPAAVIAFWLWSDLFRHTRHLGSNPIQEGEHLLGRWTLRLLLATLAITPLRSLTGWSWLIRHRRTLGLFTFAYGVLHFSTWAFLDLQLWIDDLVGWSSVKQDLLKRPFIAVGMAALTLMIPLAVTSTQSMMRRLGRRWGQLHRLIYAVGALCVVHYWMAVKRDIREPAVYGLALAALLGWRLVAARRSRRRAALARAAKRWPGASLPAAK